MADVLISVLLEQFVSITAQEAEQKIRLVVGVDEEVRKLEGNLRTVKAVLNDAEKRQATNEAVKLWLKKLEDISYEMDDVLDEWNTAMIKLKIGKDKEENTENAHVVKKKVCFFIPSPSCCFRQVEKLFLRHDIAHKIKELSGKLNEIVREREMYGFELTTRGNASEVVERPKSTSLVDVSEICGRDNVKGDLVSSLLGKGSEEERSPHVISLVGMGGIGKTTLAQLAYNDPEVKGYFDKEIWVCVSEPFDQCRVAKAIIKTFDKDYNDNSAELQVLMEKICELIKKKKFFLVLDDVWTESSTLWEPFKLALKNGAQGSRILVTTRKRRVAEMMGSLQTSESMINLEMLSEEDCWLVFRKIAFFDRDPNQCEQLEDLGRKIANKCKGLPLAAKTLGSLMRFQRNREQWENVLDSNLWELEDVEKVVEKDLFAPLLLSYYDLPSPLKQCFSYCAIFPKDYVFFSDELVKMWMAQGYINSKEDMEIIAREYFENLAIRSFFQDFKKDEDDGQIQECKMHDIVHDFAQLMSKNECFTINSGTKLKLDYKNARHLWFESLEGEYQILEEGQFESLEGEYQILEEGQFPVSIYNAKKLRTLVIKGFSWDYKFSSLFLHFRCLRSLTLNCHNNKNLDTLENCIHLRYLNLRLDEEEELLKTIYNLCNLQILKIDVWKNCMKFPDGIGKLINLRHLILELHEKQGWKELVSPRGLRRLTSLRRLSHLNVSDGCKLEELKDLNQLEGSLDIRGLGNVVDACETENAQLKKKIHLHTLKLQFTGGFENDRRMENDISVLNALKSPPNLKYLSIVRYGGTTMPPNWTMSLTKLKTLNLHNFKMLEHLPPLGKLPVLESLSIEHIYMRKVGVEFLGIESENKKEDNMQIFPNLKYLQFWGLTKWEEWIGIGGKREEEEDSNITIMPRLQRLVISNCPELNSLPDFLRTIPLKELKINGGSILQKGCQRGTGKEWRKISHIPNIMINGWHVQRDGQELKSELSWWMDDEEEHAEEEFDIVEASSSTMNLCD